MAASKKSNFSPEKLGLYEKVLRTIPAIERKGDANPYTSLNGNMFTLLHSSGTLAFRLPEEEREKFLKKYKSALFEAYGTVMKEYVVVPDSLLKKTAELARWLEISYSYAGTLRAKATKKKRGQASRNRGRARFLPLVGMTKVRAEWQRLDGTTTDEQWDGKRRADFSLPCKKRRE